MKYIFIIAIWLSVASALQCQSVREESISNLRNPVYITIVIPCSGSPVAKSATFSPMLPSWASYTVGLTGVQIAGIPRTYLERTTYTVTIVDGGNQQHVVTFKMRVDDVIKSCKYEIDGIDGPAINVPYNEFVILPKPECRAAAYNFTIAYPPDAKYMILNNGQLEIYVDQQQQQQIADRVVLNCANTISAVQITISLTLITDTETARGVSSLYSPNNYITSSPDDITPYFDSFIDGSLNDGVTIVPKFWSNKADEYLAQYGFHNVYYLEMKRAYVTVPSSESYVFRYKGDDNLWFYFGENYRFIDKTANYAEIKTFLLRLEAGRNLLTFIHYGGGGANDMYVEYRRDTETNFVEIPTEALTPYYSVVTSFKYATTDLRISPTSSGHIMPTVQGFPTSFSITPTPPAGVTFSERSGAIEYNSVQEMPRTEYQVKACSIFNCITKKVYITVVGSSSSTFQNGLEASYYSADEPLTLKSIPKVPGPGFSEVYRRIDSNINQLSFDKFSSKMSQNFIIVWEGFLTVPSSGFWEFTMECNDLCRMELTLPAGGSFTMEAINTKSQVTKKTEKELSVDPMKVKIIFGRGVTSSGFTSNDFQLKFASTNYPIQPIPANNLRYSLSQSFSYTYQVATYLSTKSAPENTPIFANGIMAMSNFVIDPELPSGMTINPTSGVIAGTPDTSSAYYDYVITADSGGVSYSTTITIGIEAVIQPTDFSYPSVIGQIPNPITPVTPTINNALNPRFYADELPYGLNVDPINGTIYGIAKESAGKQYTIKCVTNADTITTTVQINISPCSGNNVLIHGHYSVQDGDVTATVTDANGITHFAGRDHKQDTIYSYQVCVPQNANITFAFTSNCQKGGWFTINFEGKNKIHYEEYPGIRAGVRINFIAAQKSPVIIYPKNPIPIRVGESMFTSPTLEGGAYEFTISPSQLPEGLFFNTSNGAISGILKEAPSSLQTYTITGTGSMGPGTVSISFDVTECNDIPLILETYFSTDSNIISWQFLDGSGNILINRTVEMSGIVQQYGYCLPSGDYKIKVGSITGVTWLSTSYIKAIVPPITLLTANMNLPNQVMTMTVSLNYLIHRKATWSYTDNKQTSTSWTNSKSLSGWSTMVSGKGADRPATTRYYRTTMEITRSIGTLSGVELQIIFDAGMVLYLNGKKIFQKNLPEDEITADTMATKVYDLTTTPSYAIVIPSAYLVNGINYVGIEFHKHQSSLSADPFTAEASYLESADKCSKRTVSSMKAYTNGVIFEPLENTISDAVSDHTNKFAIKYQSDPATNYYAWNHRSEFINKAIFTTNAYSNDRDPTAWSLYGGKGEYVNDQSFETSFKWTKTFDIPVFPSIGANAQYEAEFLNGTSDIYDAYKIIYSGKRNPSEDLISFNRLFTYSCRIATCPQEGDWPETSAGQDLDIECLAGYSGNMQRSCLTSGIWGTPNISQCVALSLPSSLNYGNDNILSFYRSIKKTITPTIPSSQGAAGYYSSPSLPAGLSFVNKTGSITGTPTITRKLMTYTITGIAARDQTTKTYTIQLEVIASTCSAENGYPATNVGERGQKACSEGYMGYSYRTCTVSDSKPVWGEEDLSGCRPSPPIITYPAKKNTLYIDRTFDLTPNIKYNVLEWILPDYPALPAGITFSEGKFSGRATELMKETLYVVGARNLNGVYYTNLYIKVISNTCPQDGEWPATSYSISAYILCKDGKTGVLERQCRGDSYLNPQWQAVDDTDCREYVEDPPLVSGRIIAKIEIDYTTGVSGQAVNPQAFVIIRNLLITHLRSAVSFDVDRTNVRLDWDTSNMDMTSNLVRTVAFITAPKNYRNTIISITSNILKSDAFENDLHSSSSDMAYSSVIVRQTDIYEEPQTRSAASKTGEAIGIAFGVVIGTLIVIGLVGYAIINRRELVSKTSHQERSSLKATD